MNSVTKISGLYETKVVPKISKQDRKVISNAFYEISKVSWNYIPLNKIEEILNLKGFHLIQEDGTNYSGILCGREANCHIQFADENGNVPNSLICLYWYKQEYINNYEINVYLS